MQNTQNVTIRTAKLSDAPALADLSGELGYPSTPEEMRARLESISSRQDHAVFVAEEKETVGWIHIMLAQSLESEPFAEIRGMVVREAYRGSGVGTMLLAEAERWAKVKGYHRMRVRTNVLRLDTDEFFKKRGFVRKKAQDVFERGV